MVGLSRNPLFIESKPKKSRRVAAPSWTYTESETCEGHNGNEYTVEVPYRTCCAHIGGRNDLAIQTQD